MIQLLRLKCLNCHSFRLEKRLTKIFAVKFSLIDAGKCQEAMELDDLISTVVRRNADPDANPKKQGKVNVNVAAGSIDHLLREKLDACATSTSRTTNVNVVQMTLTAHERAARRQLVKDFFAACSGCKNCNNCGAYSPKLRQDNYNKVFQSPLTAKLRKINMGQNIKFYPASALKDGDDGIGMGGNTGTGGWDSDDSDMEDSDDDEDGEPAGQSTMSDDDGDLDDVALLGRKQRQSTVSTGVTPTTGQEKAASKASKPDKFMQALEVEAQARLAWKFEALICSKVFGNAHCLSGESDVNGYSIFFMRAIPVPPSRFRPPMIMGTMTVEHAQNHYLNKVLELNDRLRIAFATVQGIEGSGEDGDGGKSVDKDTVQARAISTWIDLQTTINCYIDSSKDPSAAAANNVPNGIRQLLEKKEGIFRKHMMGKRVNFACRSVISPDPYIGTNEIGIPLYFAKTLTYPTPVTALNVAEMRKLVIRGANQYPGARCVELPNGRRIELARMQQTKREAIAARLLSSNGIATVGRQLRNGDMVLMNRQVSLLCRETFA